jgi:hypothetical protein
VLCYKVLFIFMERRGSIKRFCAGEDRLWRCRGGALDVAVGVCALLITG